MLGSYIVPPSLRRQAGIFWFSLVYTNPAAGCNGFQPGFVNFIPPSYFEPG